ncbi:hypothetical protein [Streptomyces sp. KL116D]|uniref:hypothetical protein n=1 Tax=Streptomyces sp. KL116D TaxID=3045152 RepID=UPI003556ECBA
MSFARVGLFGQQELREALLGEMAGLRNAVLGWGADELLRMPVNDVIDYLVEQYSVVCPQLDRDNIHQLPVSESTVTVHDIAGRAFPRQATVMTIVVPFQGEARVFRLRPSTYTLRSWDNVQVKEGEVHVRWSGESGAGDAARRHFDSELDDIDKHLATARAQITPHNEQLRSVADRLVQERRAKLLSDRNMESSLGFPVRRREGPTLHAAPVSRRKIVSRPRPEAAGPYTPEPTLAMDDFEDVLRAIRHIRDGLERNPTTVAKLGEEDIRNQILIGLNATFEGQAAGEVFNGNGKTDILVRADGRNIFIAECKIWSGPKAVTEALDEQLLRYLVWRDTKGAFLLFIREGNPSEIIRKAAQRISKHPQCKRALSPQDNERHDFVFEPANDASREIRLAFIPFVLSAPTPRR